MEQLKLLIFVNDGTGTSNGSASIVVSAINDSPTLGTKHTFATQVEDTPL